MLRVAAIVNRLEVLDLFLKLFKWHFFETDRATPLYLLDT